MIYLDIDEEIRNSILRRALGDASTHYVGRMFTTYTAEGVRSLVESAVQRSVEQGDVPPGFFRAYVYTSDVHDSGKLHVSVMQDFEKYPITAEEYERLFGEPPWQDDLHRINCTQAGNVGHWSCGWCGYHNTRRWLCGCRAPARRT